MKATVWQFGEIDFDATNYDNNSIDLWVVAVCDKETDEVIEEEKYVDESEYRAAIDGTYGREVMDEQEEVGGCVVYCGLDEYECEAVYHIAYVIDTDED